MATILLATGDTGLYDVFSAEIGGEGHSVLWAVTGKEAYDLALVEKPDMVFLDVYLAVFDGLETCSLMRSDPELPANLPIVLLSDDEISAKQVGKARVTACFPKTHQVHELRDLLVRCLFPARA